MCAQTPYLDRTVVRRTVVSDRYGGTGIYPGGGVIDGESGIYPGGGVIGSGSGIYPGGSVIGSGSGIYPGGGVIGSGSVIYPGRGVIGGRVYPGVGMDVGGSSLSSSTDICRIYGETALHDHRGYVRTCRYNGACRQYR